MKKNYFEKVESRIASTAKRYASPMGYSKKQPLKEMTMREMLRKSRAQQVREDEAQASTETSEKQVSATEQENYERNMQDYFDDDNVTIRFEPILVYDNGVFWAGTIDGQLKFAYIVTPDESTSGVKIERSPDFDPTNEDNQSVEKKIVDYYNTFYEYWSKNQLEN